MASAGGAAPHKRSRIAPLYMHNMSGGNAIVAAAVEFLTNTFVAENWYF